MFVNTAGQTIYTTTGNMRYTYDNVGNLTTQKDPNDQLTTFEYDYSNRRTSETTFIDGEAYTTSYGYDNAGNLIYEEQPSGNWIAKEYDFKNRLEEESSSDGNYAIYNYYDNDLVKTVTSPDGITSYDYYPNGQLKTAVYPNGDVNEYIYDENGDLSQEIINGLPRIYDRDENGLTTTFTDAKGYTYQYTYTKDGLVDTIKLPNQVVQDYDYKPGLLISEINTTNQITNQQLYYNNYEHNSRDFVTSLDENEYAISYEYDDRKQLDKVITPAEDIRLYTYDNAGNRKTRSAIIGGEEFDRKQTIDIESLIILVLEKDSEKDDANNSNSKDKTNNGNNDKDKTNNGNNSNNSNNDKTTGNENAIDRGNGKKVGLLKKLGILDDEKKTGQVENIIAVIDNIVNGEVNLPPGDHEDLFNLVREVGQGYTVLGTTWTYNSRNQLTHRENNIRMEEYDYKYDKARLIQMEF